MSSSEINVIFGTETGTAEEAAHDVARFFAAYKVRSVLLPADALPLDQWCVRPTLVLVSTTGQGDFPRTIASTWDSLRMSDAPAMEGCRFSVFGLGDSTYAKYNFAAKMLHNRLRQLRAEPLVHRGLGNEQDPEGYERGMQHWLALVAASLGLTEDTAAPAADPPRWPAPVFLHKYAVSRWPIAAASSDGGAAQQLPDRGDAAAGWCSVAVLANTRLTAPAHFQAVHHLVLQRDDEHLGTHMPGDSLAVRVANPEADVAALCRLLVDFAADEAVEVRPNPLPCLVAQPDAPFLSRRLTVRELLTHHVDITTAVSRSFLRMLSAYATDPEEKERLEELCNATRLEEYNSYCYREKRGPAEVLVDFPTTRPPLSAILSALRVLQPRRFSISSSSLLDTASITLTVARLEFVTPYGRRRYGLCSAMLCNLQPGQRLDVALSRGALELPEDRSSPLVLVGPGTGFAPVRAILRHAVALGWQGSIHVFAGFRRRAMDFLYQYELEAFYPAKLPGLQVCVAFSRDQPGKRYVQHLMVEAPQRTSLARDLAHPGACVFVCGNSKQMPRDIEDALRSVVASSPGGGGGDDEDDGAADIVEVLSSEGRLFMDTWSS